MQKKNLNQNGRFTPIAKKFMQLAKRENVQNCKAAEKVEIQQNEGL